MRPPPLQAPWHHKPPLRNGCTSLEKVSLKQAHMLGTISILFLNHSVLHEGRDPIKKRNKQKYEEMYQLHSLKDSALNSFKSRKAKK
ncbi:hypothetical protein [Bartonella gabonensis]|uniref:hypothetical protein n=1 Tax=Bartonella gabonensis TaxID=2699889 RepID=UPI00158CF873|nr:hypothetical protein [Bartonella gabonensis]